MVEITGTEVIRAAARSRARESGLARLARDYSISLELLDTFVYRNGRLPATALQALAKDFFAGFAQFDAEIDRLRPINRAEPAVFATVTPPQFERRPLSDIVGVRVPPKTEPQPPAKQTRPGWAE